MRYYDWDSAFSSSNTVASASDSSITSDTSYICSYIDERVNYAIKKKEKEAIELLEHEKKSIKKKHPWLLPKKVIFSGPATTIIWTDGTKTTVKCQKNDEYSTEVGIAMCYLKKLLGNKGNYNNIFRDAMKVSEFLGNKSKGDE